MLQAPSTPDPTYILDHAKDELNRLIAQARYFGDLTAPKLGPIVQEAGLPAPQMILGARVERGPDAQMYDQVTQITRTLLPLMQRTGVATAEEVGIETLADRIRKEAVALDATVVSPSFIGAWTRNGVASPLSQ